MFRNFVSELNLKIFPFQQEHALSFYDVQLTGNILNNIFFSTPYQLALIFLRIIFFLYTLISGKPFNLHAICSLVHIN